MRFPGGTAFLTLFILGGKKLMYKKTKFISTVAILMAILLAFSLVTFGEGNKGTGNDKDQIKDEGISRGEYITLINNLLNFKEKAEIGFSDVDSDSPYANEISKALKAGYIKGRGNGIFDAEAKITIAEAYVMIGRAFKLDKGEEANAMLVFKDYAEVPQWAVGAIEGLAKKGYINDKNKVKPFEEVTASEASVLLEKINNDIESPEKKTEEVKGGGNNPLNFIEAYITTVNEDKSVDLYKLENTVDINKDGIIKLVFDRGVVRENWDNNQKHIVLRSSGGREILSEVFRIEGADSEKSFIFVKIGEELKSGKTYSIVIGKDLKANNGNTLGNEVTVTFTIK